MISSNRKYLRELKTFRNRINDDDLFWFDSLNQNNKLDLLFKWKSYSDLVFWKRKYVYPNNPNQGIGEKQIKGILKLKYFIRAERLRTKLQVIYINK